MTLKNYQEATRRTLPDLGNYQLNICHMILGLNAEFDEIIDAADNTNLSEELGDINWYLSNYCNIVGIDLTGFVFENTVFEYGGIEYIIRLQTAISKLTDIEKKELAYKKMVTKDIKIEKVLAILHALGHCYYYYKLDPYDSLQKNIDKLKARYPEKFTEELAKNRNLKKEREILEG